MDSLFDVCYAYLSLVNEQKKNLLDVPLLILKRFCTNHQSSKTPRQDTLPYELSSVAQSVISRLLLKIYEEFQSKKNESE